MELSTLKAKLVATNEISKSLETTAASADRVADSMREGAVAGTELAAGLSRSDEEATQLARSIGAANREFASGAAESAVYAEGVSEAAQQQAEASASAALLEQRLESVGDEATQSAARMGAFTAATDSVSGSALRANVAGLSGQLSTVGSAAAAATPLLLGMGSAIGGLGAGSVLAAGGGAALFAGGMQKRAEELAATTERFKNASEASEAIWSNVKEQIDQATVPLQSERAAQFATENLEAVVSLSGMAAEELADVQDTLLPLLSGLRSSALETAPEAFDALGSSVERLSPLLARADGLIESIPDGIRYFTSAAVALGPEITHLAVSAIRLGAALGDLGLIVGEVTLPPLNSLLDTATWALGVFNSLPGPVKQVAVAATLAAGGFMLASAGASALAVALSATGIPQTAIAVGVLAGVLAGLEAKFGAVSGTVQTASRIWGGFVDLAEITANRAIWVGKKIEGIAGSFTMLVPIVGPALYVLANLETIMNKAGAAADWLSSKIKQLAKFADKYLGGLLDKLDMASEQSEKLGGIDLDGAKFGSGGDDSGSSGGTSSSSSGGSDRTPPPPPAASTSSDGSGPTVDMSGSKFYGTKKSDIKQWVHEAVEEANSSSRQREDAQGG